MIAEKAPTAVPDRLDAMFSSQARATPNAPAILFKGSVLSYDELSRMVATLAADLIRADVAPGVIVAVDLPRTPLLIAAILAILEAGGAYLPLDSRNPAERTGFVLADSGASLLITGRAVENFTEFSGAIFGISPDGLIERARGAAPLARGPGELAYVLYTSGSTGQPKGVMLGHGAIHLVEWARQTYSSRDLSRVAATTSACFDPSIFEIFVPLCTGGAMILKTDALERFAPDERPTLLDTVPSVLEQLCRMDAIPPSLRVLNVGGEALPGALAREVHKLHPTVTLYNHYGPTEATTCATVAKVTRGTTHESVPIGGPVRGAEILLLGRSGLPVAEGQVGEIHIGGPGLALGYLGRPDLTQNRFISRPAGRFYRTGDLARWRGGQLYFEGRLDHQVKVRGFRIELGEIEAALLRISQVDRALVTMRQVGGRPQIVAYVESRQALTPDAVRQNLRAWLPDYMLPAWVVVLSAFPLLISGKIDITSLPAPDEPSEPAAIPALRMEKPIIHVFEEVLGRGGIRPIDSFFDLGGDSLSSVEAALRLGEILGYELPSALIHQAPTPRALAQSLDHGRVRTDRHISLLQPGRPEAPLFCMADLFGQPFNYLSLARRLGAHRAVYGVAPGPLQEAFTLRRDVGELTDSFVAELRSLRPEGPYLIAGYSAGGMLAHDLACALEAEGEAVCLILLDSYLYSRRHSPAAVLRRLLGKIRPHDCAKAVVSDAGKVKVRPLPWLRELLRRRAPSWIPRSQLRFALSMIKAGAVYRPKDFKGAALVVKAGTQDPVDRLFDHDGVSGWARSLKGELVQVRVEGAHHHFLREPLVSETAQVVRRFLLSR